MISPSTVALLNWRGLILMVNIFLPLIILIIYVGAIAVLFLFVIMMCKHTVTNQNMQAHQL